MNFKPISLTGAFLVELPRHRDERGHFYEGFHRELFREHGLEHNLDQVNFSHSNKQYTLRGLHFQRGWKAQAKFVMCTGGAILDVLVDLRPSSPTYLQSETFAMSRDSLFGIYVPKGFAHGWVSLVANSGIMYFVSGFWSKAHESGVRHDDPALRLTLPVREINERDASWPMIRPGQA